MAKGEKQTVLVWTVFKMVNTSEDQSRENLLCTVKNQLNKKKMDGHMDGRKGGWMDRWMDRRLDGWMHLWMDGQMDG